jgi:group I intron endonuclease
MKPEICTIYLLTNKINAKIYIGQTWLLLKRRMGKTGENYNNSPYLYNAIKKYGVDQFEYEVLETCTDQDAADILEDKYINLYDSRNLAIGYNLKGGGSHGLHSEETKAKIAKTMTEKVWSEEALEGRKIGGRLWAGKERGPHNEEWKENNSNQMIAWHAKNPHPMEGQHHTPEAKVKIGEASKGRKRSPEAIAQGAAKRKIKPEREKAIVKAYTDGKTIKEINASFQTGNASVYRILKRNNIELLNNFSKWEGKTHTEETKLKQSEARTTYWNEKK